MADRMTEHQTTVASGVLDEECARRRQLVIALTGSHAYGFTSPDSDLDLKGIHVDPTAKLLGLHPAPTTAARLEVLDGVEIDFSSNELGGVLLGILKGNGNYLERVLGPTMLRTSPEYDELRPLVERSLSRRLVSHYRGFARGQLLEFEKSGGRSAKKLLYVLRTALTGTHALRSGRIVTDLGELAPQHGLGAVSELIAAKRAGERVDLEPDLAQRWRAEVDQVFARLEGSVATSCLPVESPNVADLEAWLVEVRRRCW